MNVGVVVHEVDAVEPVQVLVERDLEDGRAALARSDDRRREEVQPDLWRGTRRAAREEGEVRGLSQLPARSQLARGSRGTYAVPALAVLGEDLLLVLDPVLVPPVQRRRVCTRRSASRHMERTQSASRLQQQQTCLEREH